MTNRFLLTAAPALVLLTGATEPPGSALDSTRCSALAQTSSETAPVAGLKFSSATWREAGTIVDGRGGKSPPLPAHCALTGFYGERPGLVGGPATDRFDSLTALEDWVARGKATDDIKATAGQATPWPGRERPLCPWPSVARQVNRDSFACVKS